MDYESLNSILFSVNIILRCITVYAAILAIALFASAVLPFVTFICTNIGYKAGAKIDKKDLSYKDREYKMSELFLFSFFIIFDLAINIFFSFVFSFIVIFKEIKKRLYSKSKRTYFFTIPTNYIIVTVEEFRFGIDAKAIDFSSIVANWCKDDKMSNEEIITDGDGNILYDVEDSNFIAWKFIK